MYTFLDNMFKVLKVAANNEQQIIWCQNEISQEVLEKVLRSRNNT